MHVDWRKFATIVTRLAPIGLEAAGVPPELTGQITHLMVLAETKPGASGPEKKAYVLDALRTSAGITDGFVHPNVQDVDVDQLVAAASAGIDGAISMVNAVKNIPVKAVSPK
jgi:hypothetical protein